MSPASVSNFVGDLVAMATAFEKLPEVQADLDSARKEIAGLATTVARLEAKLLDRANEIETHLSTIRALEVARDDAQFHALEADDRTSRALDFIKATFGNAGSLIQALEPPVTPQPVAEPSTIEPKPYLEQVSEGVPFREIYSPSPAPEVAPTSSPTPAPANPIGTGMENVASGSEPTPDAPTPPAPLYSGLTYSRAKDILGSAFTWPDKEDWLNGGGTVDNFYA